MSFNRSGSQEGYADSRRRSIGPAITGRSRIPAPAFRKCGRPVSARPAPALDLCTKVTDPGPESAAEAVRVKAENAPETFAEAPVRKCTNEPVRRAVKAAAPVRRAGLAPENGGSGRRTGKRQRGRGSALMHIFGLFGCLLAVGVLLSGVFIMLMPQVEHWMYPLKYEGIIRQASAEAGISPALTASVILAESGFNPEARSCVGAVGLMQLMPETAVWMAEYSGIRLPDKSNAVLTDPEYNIRLGAQYISWLMHRFGMRKVEALAAYNAGQHEVDSWIERRGHLRIRDIPVGETRCFVGKVLKNERRYLKLYPELGEPYEPSPQGRTEEE